MAFSDQNSEDLEQILYNQGIISQKDIEEAKTYAKNTNQDLATVLIEIGKLTEESIAFAISNELGIPLMEVLPSMVDREKIKMFSSETLWRCRAIPLFQGEEILVVMSNPLDESARDELVDLFGDADISFAIGTSSSIVDVLKSCFQQSEFQTSATNIDNTSKGVAEDPGAVLFITRHLNEAFQANASEIDFKPSFQELQVYYRFNDTVMYQESVPPSFSLSIAQHLKSLAGISMMANEVYRRPFRANIQGQSTPIRLTFLRSNLGDRILVTFETHYTPIPLNHLSQIGFNKEEIQRILSLPQGMFILANPNLASIRKLAYTFLEEYAKQGKKVFVLEIGTTQTLENAVQIDISQSRFTWENIIVENPDVLYIEGTVPPQYWPYLASSRLVWLSIPASSNVDAICLALKQIPDILLSRILRGVLVFSHLDLLCQKCKKSTEIPELLLQLEPSLGDLVSMQREGCPECQNTGYQGEIFLMDMIWADKVLREFMANSPSRYDIANHLGDFGNSILNQITTLVQEGKISLQEVWKWI